MTINDVKNLTANTEEFEAAVDAASDAAATGDKEAGKVLAFLLMKNEDFVNRCAYGR